MNLEEAKKLFDEGSKLKQENKNIEAILAFSKIENNTFVVGVTDLYERAQLLLAILFDKLNKLEEAKKCYQNLKRSCIKKNFASAQFGLGYISSKVGDKDSAQKHYKKVKREDSTIAYACAQYNLWGLTKNIIYLKHIVQDDGDTLYEQAQFKLGELEYISNNARLSTILNYWENIPENSKWYPKIYYKKYLIRKVTSIHKHISIKLLEIFKKVDLLLNLLIIKNVNEDLIAHYTSPFVAKLLIANNVCGNFKNSRMRLNTIDLMNDPTEGKILNHYLNLSSDLISTNDQAFMACFTLHHDSLNQFRLYGKENQKEGSGLSLILSNQFFEQENSFSNIRLQNANNSVSEVTEDVDHPSDVGINSAVKEFNEKIIQKLPLYRCIYIDPDSKLIEISHREEWTFCREEKKTKSDKWESYSKGIDNLRDQVREDFQNLIQPLYQKISENIKKYSNEAELLAEILLPLRFLVKHMAFKEEQECRVVYVTQWDDHFVQYDENLKRFYIDYGQDVVTHLKKIYLGPHAVHEKNMFEYLCSHAKQNNRTEHEVKIKTSHNPLR